MKTQKDNNSYAYFYAKAIFALASARQEIPVWGKTLDLLASIVASGEIKQLCCSPQVTPQQWLELFTDIFSSIQIKLSPAALNFIRLLSEQRHLPLASQIATAYQTIQDEQNKILKVAVSSAQDLSDGEKAKLLTSLSMNRNYLIQPDYTIKPELLGGAMIRIKDKIIDASILGQLQRLQKFLIT